MTQRRWRTLAIVASLLGVLFGLVAVANAQKAEPLDTPKVQQAITHIRIGSIEIVRGKLGVTAVVGYMNDDNIFIAIEQVEMSWSRAKVAANLTTEEKAALVSIRNKAKAAIKAKFMAAP